MRAVHFGAGNIGRGFIGNLLYQSGYEICFIDVADALVQLLNERREYTVILADETHEEFVVKNVSAINSQSDPERVIDAISQADLVTAAVGPTVLPLIAEIVAKGLQKRLQEGAKPLNIIACENMIGASTLLKEKVYEKISPDDRAAFDQHFGFPDAAVDRIVPNQNNEDKLTVKVEPFYEWVVNQTQVIGEKPPVKGITYVDDLNPYIERKLFTVNTGHAITAYLGYAAGIPTIDQAMQDASIRSVVTGALAETGAVLMEKHGFAQAEHEKYIQKILGRFTNKHITDEVTRVGRAPIRKLGPNDRLVSPAKQYLELFGHAPAHLVKGIASALKFDFKEDAEAVRLQETIQNHGVKAAIQEYCGLDADAELTKLILNEYK
ncbi:mannitol-1-phosphate 5-dehydrogenase [Tuberibacillus calidus]|uniref:mannitol-1-phosphate 5-dehydrogenase n=1 Tax=Tuberibacillus calidus TaxID=340097 RepID=UPI000412EB05|nr:mannitol-1-phosphate 5-dehydrogenase [Tuberibacillus calidus]